MNVYVNESQEVIKFDKFSMQTWLTDAGMESIITLLDLIEMSLMPNSSWWVGKGYGKVKAMFEVW